MSGLAVECKLGTNVLRGGKNVYSVKTLEGSWVDRRKEVTEAAPPVAETETQIRAVEGA
jgi:hypothetical protein